MADISEIFKKNPGLAYGLVGGGALALGYIFLRGRGSSPAQTGSFSLGGVLPATGWPNYLPGILPPPNPSPDPGPAPAFCAPGKQYDPVTGTCVDLPGPGPVPGPAICSPGSHFDPKTQRCIRIPIPLPALRPGNSYGVQAAGGVAALSAPVRLASAQMSMG